jgi:hypothetical protein
VGLWRPYTSALQASPSGEVSVAVPERSVSTGQLFKGLLFVTDIVSVLLNRIPFSGFIQRYGLISSSSQIKQLVHSKGKF